MNPYSIPNFIVSIYTLSLGAFALISNPRGKKNFLFFLLTLLTFIWLFLYGMIYSCSNYSYAEVLSKIGHAAVIFLTPVFYFFLLSILGSYRKRTHVILAWLSLLYAFISVIGLYKYGSYYLPQLNKYYWGYYPIGGPLMLSYALWTGLLVIVALHAVYQTLKQVKNELAESEYQRLRYHFISLVIFAFSVIDYLPKFKSEVYPFGYIFVGGFASITSYAIIKHKLLDINIIIRRSFVYSLLIFVLTFIYLSVILISEYLFRSYFGYKSLLVAIMASLVVAIAFNPLRSRIQKILDKYFFKIDSDKLIEENVKLKEAVQKQDQMKAVATLAAGMAHEIKNPLTAIKTFTEHLPEKSNDPLFIKTFTKVVGTEVEKINSIVKQLLEFSKPSPLQLEKLSINQVIEETLELLNAEFLKHQIQVNKHLSADLPLINGDKKQLKQAFLNLFLNSIQAMHNGGTLTVSTSLRSIGHRLLIAVSDTGSGISKEQLPHIFDPFYTTKESGTGLGLSIVHGIIKEHDGEIEVSSEVGQETAFKISLRQQ